MVETKITSVIARTDDGTVQLTMTVPASVVAKKKDEALEHLAAELEVPGFRKGKAPREVAQKHLDSQKIYEHSLQHLLPEAYSAAVEEHKLKPVLNPRFELLSAKDGEDWQVRAITCEAPEVLLDDYKKVIAGELRAASIKKESSREEKEQQVIKALIENAQVKIPKLLIDEEVNHRLAKLVDELQKLGLTVEQYLSSTKKTAETLRAQYQQNAQDAIKLEIALNKIAEEEKVVVSEKEIEQLIAASGDKKTQEALQSPSQKQLIESVLRRRAALDRLVNLV